MPDRDDLLARLARFEKQYFPRYEKSYRRLVEEGQQPKTLFIGCSDSRIVPYALMDCGPGDLFIARNVGNLVPPWDMSAGFHGTAAAIEFAVLQLKVQNIIVCGHSHCGAIRGLYQEPPAEARHLRAWLDLARGAALPAGERCDSRDALCRVEQRSIIIQLERLMSYPMVASRVRAGELFLHGWYYVIEAGQVLVLDTGSGHFEPLQRQAPPAPAATTPTEIDAGHWARFGTAP
jgi:carbonic anhydrase